VAGRGRRAGGADRIATRKARLERHAGETDPEVVLNAAARYLETRSRTVDEVRRHLARAAYPAALVEGAIDRLLELGMLDDSAFARSWIESRDRARPRGRQALRRELALKGIDRDTIEKAIGERDPGGAIGDGALGGAGDVPALDMSADERAAERLLSIRSPALLRVADPRARRQRAYALLARNGFDADVCRDISARFAAASDGPDSAE
jgi:regulatory protein